MREFWFLSWQVTKRHFHIYLKDWFANMAPTIIDPFLFIVAFGLGLGGYIEGIADKQYIQYLAPGLVATTALFTAFFETSYGFFVRMQFESIYKALLTTPIGPSEIICGEFLWVGLKGLVMSSAVSVVFLLFGIVKLNYLFLIPILGFLLAMSCGAIGLIATALVKNINQFQTIYALIISPMFFFSGVFYPDDNLPQIAKFISKFSPLYHGVKLSQHILWGENVWSALFVHGGVLLIMTVPLVYIAVKLIKPKLVR